MLLAVNFDMGRDFAISALPGKPPCADALAAGDVPWIVYFHQPTGSPNAIEVRVLRGARVA